MFWRKTFGYDRPGCVVAAGICSAAVWRHKFGIILAMKGLGSDSFTRRLLVEMSAVRAGFADKKALQTAFAEALLVLPVAGEQHDLLAADHSGISWVLAFTSMREFASYGRTQGAGDRQWDYLTCRGNRLRDIVSGTSRGIALDVAGKAPLLLPPGWDREGEDARG